jgi:hypothetical protein
MRTTVISLLCLLLMSSAASAQTPFPTSGATYVTAYKEGTNCSPTGYKFYTLNATTGAQSSTPFLTTSTTTEINGIGLNTDGYGYGIQYDRAGNVSPCSFSNFTLIRFDAAGNVTKLGAIAPPQGGTAVTAAIGFVVPSNRFVMFATVGSTVYMGFINNIPSLTASTDTLTPQYFPLSFNCTGKQYADFALNPIDGKFYTYGTYQNGASYEGTLMKLDPETQIVSCVGAAGTGIFTNANDNFGGVMFDSNGDMVGLNINTKKLYKINVTTGTPGAVSYMSTVSAATGTIRGDLGSNAIGSTPIALPLALLRFNGKHEGRSDRLAWTTDNEPFASFEIQSSYDGRSFSTQGSVSGEHYTSGATGSKEYVWHAGVRAPYYRLKMIEFSGRASYSGVVSLGKTGDDEATVSLYPNPASDVLVIECPSAGAVTLCNALGSVMLQAALSDARNTVDISRLPEGVYNATVECGTARTVRKVIVQR